MTRSQSRNPERTSSSKRKLYRSPCDNLLREVWQPGDEEGDMLGDYFDRSDHLPLQQRWKLFQSDIGEITAGTNEPPRNTLLDDRAAWELIQSNVPRSRLTDNWDHDFASHGKLRASRPHRGRPAIRDPRAEGDEKYHSIKIGNQPRYYFKGERNYVPVKHKIPAKPPPPKSPTPSPPPTHARAHGHNQWTPREQLVRLGAPSFSRSGKQKRAKINRVLWREGTPYSRSNHKWMEVFKRRDQEEGWYQQWQKQKVDTSEAAPNDVVNTIERAAESDIKSEQG